MFDKITLTVLICLLSCLRSGAQDKDSSWYYANTLNDYARADLVCLVRVGETKLLDTIGGYTIQEVSFEPLRFYKGATPQRKFRAWLENHEVVWKPGTIHGYYLLKGEQDPAYRSGQDEEMYYWLENAGFPATDTPLIAGMSDTGYFKSMVTQYILPGIAGSWAKVSLLSMTSEANEDYHGALNAHIRLEQDLPALGLNKGQTIPAIVRLDTYTKQQELSRLQKKGTSWEVILYREDGLLNMDTLFMQER